MTPAPPHDPPRHPPEGGPRDVRPWTPLRLSVTAALVLLVAAATAPGPPADQPSPLLAVQVPGQHPLPLATTGSDDRVAVVVQAPGAEAHATAAVHRLGGRITAALPIIDGFSARLPAAAVERLAATPGVLGVTPDQRLEPTGSFTEGGQDQTAHSVYHQEIGSDVLAAAGLTGSGVRVALVDTGVSTAVAQSGDLAGRVVPVADPWTPPATSQPDPPLVPCVNLSGEPTCDDTFGHGTFMAGLIAGSGAASEGRHRGVAPGADIVSLKVGGADGSADVSKVLAAIQWVASFADHYDIKVLNLALGTDSTVPVEIDPLNLAVQRAWVAGITVVVAAGNLGAGPRSAPDGSEYGTVTKPGDDPFVLTVGAVDDRETTEIADDRLPDFSSWGPTAHGRTKPDVVAPGGRVVSLRAPGSTVDGLPGLLDGTYRRGSGTSMAAAVTSGLAALLLEARDGGDGQAAWRPDDAKAALVASAVPVATDDVRAIGAGLVQGPAALAATIAPQYRTSVLSDGSGRLNGSRGTVRVLTGDCTRSDWEGSEQLLHGFWTAQCLPWQGGQYAESDWTPQSWYASQWFVGAQGHNWQATTWADGHNWQGHNWQGSRWHDQTAEQSYGEPGDGSASHGAWG